MMTFSEFKTSQPAQAMFRKLGLSEYLDAAQRAMQETVAREMSRS